MAKPAAKEDAARSLPRGPHGLSREEVERSQRERLLLAMAECVAEKGFSSTSVADVIARAGVSRATFYEQFKDKEDCFRATSAIAAQHIGKVMGMGVAAMAASAANKDTPLTPLQKLERILVVYLDTLASNPAYARTFLVDVYAAGPEAIKQRLASQKIFANIICETHRGEKGPIGTDPEQRFAAEAFVNAVSAMMTNLVAIGEFDKIRELKEPLMKFVTDLTAHYKP